MGCFRLSLGNQAQGDFAGHVLTINVSAQGEACLVDGAVFNCSGCIDGSRSGCPATLTVHSRDPDGSVNFFVARQVAGQIYVTTQANFDDEARLLESAKKGAAKPVAAFNAGTPIPDGSYSSWPEDSKRKAVSALGFRCAMVSAMQLGSYQGSKEAAGELAKAMSMACVDHQMPADWPERASVQAIEKEYLDKARQLDPSISVSPDQLWAELAKKIQADDTPGIGAKP